MAATYGPYTPIRQAGDLLFVSGQVGIDVRIQMAPQGVIEQTAQALANLQAVLETAGAQLRDVVKTTIFLADMDDFAAMNEVYEQWFDVPRPARSTIAVRELPRLATDIKLVVEIEAVALKERA